MKLLPFTVAGLLASLTMLALPVQEAMAQGKGGARAGGAKGGSVGGAKGSSVSKVGGATGGAKGVSGVGGSTVNRAVYGVGGSGYSSPLIISSGIAGYPYGYGSGLGLGIGNGGGYYGYNDYPLAAGLTLNNNIYPSSYQTAPYPAAAAVDPYYANNPNIASGRTFAAGKQFSAFSPNVESIPLPKSTTAAVATVQVSLPTDTAELWFNGVKTQTTGQKREFVTPELAPEQTYTYEIRVKWTMNGKDYDQTKSFTVHAGSQIVVNITMDQREQLPIPVGIKI